MERKWSLKVLIAHSVALRRCMPGGRICKLMFLALNSRWKAGDYLLSSCNDYGLIYQVRRCLLRFFKTRKNSLDVCALF